TVNNQTATGPTFTVASKPANPANKLTITGLSPKSGTVGTSVTITGTNFSETKADNTVTFNGTPATVSSATATELKVTVPAKATTGPVKVTTNGQTANGATFTVTKAPVPQVTITGLSPKSGPVGTSVTI